MIFVTTGTHPLGFDRLVRAMDEIAPHQQHDILMQVGVTGYEPKHTDWFRFADSKEMIKLSRKADLVVCQGAMSGLVALEQGTPIVVFPRRKKYKEHIDDHQVEFAQVFTDIAPKSSVVALDTQELREAVSKTFMPPDLADLYGRRKMLIGALRNFLVDIA